VRSVGATARATVLTRVERHLRVLVDRIGARPPGSASNRRATDYLSRVLSRAGWMVREQPFSSKVWCPGPARLVLGTEPIELEPPPFSLRCRARGRIRHINTVDEIERPADISSSIVVLGGELAGQQVFPKSFPFLTIPEQQRLVSVLERRRPVAVLAVAASEEPFEHIFEDGDLCFPYATIPPSVAARLESGQSVELQLDGSVRVGHGANVSACSGAGEPSIVISAHMDSKATTPGAFDNASGVAVVLALAELRVRDRPLHELVFFNGEDHYAAPGQQAWLAQADLGRVGLAINFDGVGAVGRPITIAPIGVPPELERVLAAFISEKPGFELGDPWFEGDHAIFVQAGIPSLAVTSSDSHELARRIAHGPADTLEEVDADLVADTVYFLDDLLSVLRRNSGRDMRSTARPQRMPA
jgi:aminopeptidase YwaD